jgi:predicted transcriptional regulator
MMAAISIKYNGLQKRTRLCSRTWKAVKTMGCIERRKVEGERKAGWLTKKEVDEDKEILLAEAVIGHYSVHRKC